MYELMALGFLAAQCGPRGCPIPPRQAFTPGVMLAPQTFAPVQQAAFAATAPSVVQVAPARVPPPGPVRRPGLLRRVFSRLR